MILVRKMEMNRCVQPVSKQCACSLPMIEVFPGIIGNFIIETRQNVAMWGSGVIQENGKPKLS